MTQPFARSPAVAVMAVLLLSPTLLAEDRPRNETYSPPDSTIQWYGTWKQAAAEARRTQRPILLTSAAPQCHGVSGLW